MREGTTGALKPRCSRPACKTHQDPISFKQKKIEYYESHGNSAKKYICTIITKPECPGNVKINSSNAFRMMPSEDCSTAQHITAWLGLLWYKYVEFLYRPEYHRHSGWSESAFEY